MSAAAPPAADASAAALRWMVAALSFGSAAVHLVMVPQHAQESTRAGLAFAAVGWFQIAVGLAVLLSSRRAWLWAAVVGNLVLIAVWVLSRTAGLPSWTGDGGVEAVRAADVTCVVFEGVLVALAFLLLWSPRALEHWTREAVPAAAVVAIVVLVGTTAVLAAPSTAGHTHDDGATVAAGHVHGADGHDREVTAATATRDDVHATDATHVHAGSGPAAVQPHGHAESTIAYDDLPRATKGEVDQVRAIWANKYATAADAVRDGWFRATRSLYGIGAHYLRGRGFATTATFDLLNPNILLFDGDGPDAKFAGVSYIVSSPAPEGYTGDFDAWHAHASVCSQGGTIISLNEDDSPVWLSESDCIARGGRVLPLANDEMIHVWIGPEYIEGAPIFAHDHPKLFDGYDPKRDV